MVLSLIKLANKTDGCAARRATNALYRHGVLTAEELIVFKVVKVLLADSQYSLLKQTNSNRFRVISTILHAVQAHSEFDKRSKLSHRKGANDQEIAD